MTNRHPHLNKAPIKEAVIQILVAPSDTYNQDLPTRFIEAEKKHYPTIAGQRETVIQLISGKDGNDGTAPGITDKGLNGYRLSSADGLNIIQLYKDRFSYSRLEPYLSWNELSTEMRRLWGVYVGIFGPKSVKGVSVRYINQFMLPPSMKDFEDYLECVPNIPRNLPQSFASFYVNYQLPDPDSHAIANVRLLFEGVKYQNGSKEPLLPIVLDTDTFLPFEEKPDNTEGIWTRFAQLHGFKNEIFFSIVKEAALEMFQ